MMTVHSTRLVPCGDSRHAIGLVNSVVRMPRPGQAIESPAQPSGLVYKVGSAQYDRPPEEVDAFAARTIRCFRTQAFLLPARSRDQQIDSGVFLASPIERVQQRIQILLVDEPSDERDIRPGMHPWQCFPQRSHIHAIRNHLYFPGARRKPDRDLSRQFLRNRDDRVGRPQHAPQNPAICWLRSRQHSDFEAMKIENQTELHYRTKQQQIKRAQIEQSDAHRFDLPFPQNAVHAAQNRRRAQSECAVECEFRRTLGSRAAESGNRSSAPRAATPATAASGSSPHGLWPSALSPYRRTAKSHRPGWGSNRRKRSEFSSGRIPPDFPGEIAVPSPSPGV